MRGRKPKDSAVQSGGRARRPSKNETPARETLDVDKSVFAISPPSGLAPEALRHWKEVVPRLEAAQLLSSLDTHILAEFCECAAQIDSLKAFLKERGYFVERSNGPKLMRAEAKLLDMERKRLVKLSDCLGLSPAARKRMGISFQLKSKLPECWNYQLTGDENCQCEACRDRRAG